MGKVKTRLKGSKGKRWAKGQSCRSNPAITRHRDAAKNNFFQPFLSNTKLPSKENAGLTEEALKQHTYASHSLVPQDPDARSECITAPPSVINDDFSDDASVRSGFSFRSSSSFKTFATGFTNCSNTSFNKLYRGFTPNSEIHKAMLAVLAGTSEAIKEQGGKESETEYFGVLMTTLDAVGANEDTVAATVCLLSMVIKRVPPSVLKLKFSIASKSLLDLLGQYIESENSMLVRHLIGCLGVLLRNQNASVWADSSTLQVYDALLTFVVHAKPKIRKAAQHAICAILKASTLLTEGEDPPLLHPVALHTGKYCLNFIQEPDRELSALLHMLNLLKEIFGVLPKNEVKMLCESLLSLMRQNNVLLTSCVMQSFYGLMNSRPKPISLPADLNSKLITALYDYQPLNDTQRVRGWLSVMTQAHLNLGRLDAVLAAKRLPQFFSVATQFWTSEIVDIVKAVSPSLSSLLNQCLEPALSSNASLSGEIEKLIGSIEKSLGWKFVKATKYVIHLSTTMIEVVGKSQPALLSDLLSALAGMRISPGFLYEEEVDYAVGKAVRICGPRFVLQSIPLNITGDEKSYDFAYSWILPILRENISHTEIGFFFEYFHPLAEKFRRRIVSCTTEKDVVGIRVYGLLQSQIWALLPGFFKYPTDAHLSFNKNVAQLLGDAIDNRPNIRMDVMGALRQLIIHSKEDATIRSVISRYAKNYLPRLFNLYCAKAPTDELESQRISSYETINYFLQITDTQLLHCYFDKVISKLETVNNDMKNAESSKELAFEWECDLDLVRALITYQDEKRVDDFVRMAKPWLAGTDAKPQKKAYRIIEDIVCDDKKIIGLAQTMELFDNSRDATKPTSKASRLRSLSHITQLFDDEPNPIIRKFLFETAVEAVCAVEEVNEKARVAAHALLIDVGRVLQKWSPDGPQEAISDYLTKLLKGTEGGDALVSATVISVTSIVREFAAHCTEKLIDTILERVCKLLVTSTRPVVLACLDFIRMFMSAVHSRRLPFYLERLVESLSGMDEEHKSAYRNRTRDILSRMMRKCGADAVIMMVPQDDVVLLKRLKNLKKIEARKKKEREQGRKNVDDDGEEEEETMATQPKTMEHVLADSDEDDLDEKDVKDPRKRSLKTWIQEDESSIVDFLDPAASKKVTATNPLTLSSAVAAKKKKSESIFKTAPDGRLIIKDCSDSESESDKSDEGDISQAFDNLQMEKPAETAGRKRKLDNDEDMDQDEPSFKYQAGGSGIHRPIGKEQNRGGVRKLTSKKRAQESEAKSKPVDYGSEYRSAKARGDVKRKGRPDPFAYIPLTKSSLNKRNRAKAAGQFKGLVGSGRRAGKAAPHIKNLVSSARKEALTGQLALARKGALVRSKPDTKAAKS